MRSWVFSLLVTYFLDGIRKIDERQSKAISENFRRTLIRVLRLPIAVLTSVTFQN